MAQQPVKTDFFKKTKKPVECYSKVVPRCPRASSLAGNLVGSRFQEWKFMPGISDYGKPVIHWVARVQIPPSAPQTQPQTVAYSFFVS